MREKLIKANETFLEVCDSISPEEHGVAYRSLWIRPMAFFYGRTVEECVKLFLVYERDMKDGKFGTTILTEAEKKSLIQLYKDTLGM